MAAWLGFGVGSLVMGLLMFFKGGTLARWNIAFNNKVARLPGEEDDVPKGNQTKKSGAVFIVLGVSAVAISLFMI